MLSTKADFQFRCGWLQWRAAGDPVNNMFTAFTSFSTDWKNTVPCVCVIELLVKTSYPDWGRLYKHKARTKRWNLQYTETEHWSKCCDSSARCLVSFVCQLVRRKSRNNNKIYGSLVQRKKTQLIYVWHYFRGKTKEQQLNLIFTGRKFM